MKMMIFLIVCSFSFAILFSNKTENIDSKQNKSDNKAMRTSLRIAPQSHRVEEWIRTNSIPDSVFLMTSLLELKLYYFKLDSVADKFHLLPELETFELSSCKECNFKDLLSKLKKCKKLKHLRLQANDLDSLPDNISELENLEILDLRGNNIKKLPKSLENSKKLRSISLSSNDMNTLPHNLEKIQSLEELYISSMFKLEINDALKRLKNLKNLRVLSFYGCNIEAIPEELKYLDSLVEVGFSDNKITEIPCFICEMEHLSTMLLFYNDVNKLPDCLKFIKTKKNLVLSVRNWTAEEREKIKSEFPNVNIMWK